MSKISGIWKELTDENGDIRWPEEEEARSAVARRIFALVLLSGLDSWYQYASDVIKNPAPKEPFPRENHAHYRDKSYREAFAGLSDPQKEMVLKLVREVLSGASFSLLVEIDQFPRGNLEIWFSDRTHGKDVKVQVTPQGEGLHDLLFGWILENSQYAGEFLKRVPRSSGTGFGLELQ